MLVAGQSFGAGTALGAGRSDQIDGGSGDNYLRGDDGDDSIVGGAGFDDGGGVDRRHRVSRPGNRRW